MSSLNRLAHKLSNADIPFINESQARYATKAENILGMDIFKTVGRITHLQVEVRCLSSNRGSVSSAFTLCRSATMRLFEHTSNEVSAT